MSGTTAVIYAESLSNRGGTGVYLRRLLQGIIETGTDDVLAAVSGRLTTPAEALRRNTCSPSGPGKVLAEHLRLPRLAATASPGMVHLPAFGGRPPRGIPYAVTLHDLAFRADPSWFPPLRSLYYRISFSRISRKADLVMVDSDFTGREAIRLLGLPPERIRRVYLSTGSFMADPGHFTRQYGVTGPYAVFVGTVEPRKNVGALLEAWAIVRERCPDLALVVAGRWGWGDLSLRRRLGASPGVIWPGGLPEPMLKSCISGARMLVYPSLYEGFGLPPLEAASVGVQSVVTPAGALSEIYGKISHVCADFQPESIARAVMTAIEDPRNPGSLMEFAERFSNLRMARSVLEVYRELAS